MRVMDLNFNAAIAYPLGVASPVKSRETAGQVPQPTVSDKAVLVWLGLCALGIGGLLIGVV